jgi:hypothetical protein
MLSVIFVCTRGEEETMLTTLGDEDIVVLNNRKGFVACCLVRLVLSFGADLVPVFGVWGLRICITRILLSFYFPLSAVVDSKEIRDCLASLS